MGQTQLEINNIIASSGNFITNLTIGSTGVSLSGHTHTSNSITDFNSAVIAASPEEIVEYATSNDFPVSGVASILYLSTDASKSYRWAGNAYVEIGPSPSFVANHTHSSADITNFNTSVSGLLPVKNIVAGSGVSIVSNESIFTVNVIEDIRWLLFLPPAPTNVAGTAGNGQVTLTWTAPTVLAQTPITDYVVQYSSNSGSTWTTFSDGTSTTASATVTGLTNGTAYTFRVAAVNAIGTGAYSTTSSAVTPAAAPTLTRITNGTNGSFTGSGTAADPFVAATYQGGFIGAARFQISGAGTLRILYNSDSEDLPAFQLFNDAGGTSLVSGDSGTNISKTYVMSANQIVRIVADFGALTNLRVWATS